VPVAGAHALAWCAPPTADAESDSVAGSNAHGIARARTTGRRDSARTVLHADSADAVANAGSNCWADGSALSVTERSWFAGSVTDRTAYSNAVTGSDEIAAPII